jgi:hypothetical protein
LLEVLKIMKDLILKHILTKFLKFVIVLLIVFLTFSTQHTYAGGSQKLLITEFMIYNDSILADEDGEFSDWIEIYNPGSLAVNLLNWSLTDDQNNKARWYFPNIQILPNQYLVVFASGKDRKIPGKNLHTNFKLSAGDGFLALVEPDSISLSSYYYFPEQYNNISYGCYNSANYYFDYPTPGTANVASTFVPAALFSVKRGFYTTPLNVVLNSVISGATIRYTKNGSYPSETDGIIYTSPILITTTTPLRAVVYYNGKKSFAATQTYIFLNDVRTQSNTPSGYPTKWGPYTAISGNAIADYEMDPEIVNNPLYRDSIDKAFKSIPTVSVVTSVDNLFLGINDSIKGGIYYWTGAPEIETSVPAPVGTTVITTYGIGHDWGRPASVEYMDITNSKEFVANCRLELHGGHSRRAEKTPKHSFNLEFKSDYGVSKLNFNLFNKKSAVNEFDALVLRGNFGNSWLHVDYNQRKRGMYIHDTWLKDSQLEMGEKSAHTKFVHLYLNGIYWGLYCISERLDKDFAESYFKGKEDDFDIIKDYGEASSGTIDAWNTMMLMANAGLSNNSDYFKIQGKNSDGTDNSAYPSYLSIDNFIDFMLVNIYGGNNDWDTHNWTAIRNRIDPGNGFKFLVWDGERILEGLNDNVVTKNNLNRPTGIYTKLRENAEFRLEFADHVQSHLFNNGALTPSKVAERWLKRSNEIQLAIICESARWGDYRRDVHPYGGSNYELCTKATYWDVEQTRLLNDYFPQRTQIVIDQLKSVNLYPSVVAPSLSWYGGKFVADTTISITAPAGTIYYTTDGTDPRLIGGNVSSSAKVYSGTPILLADTTILKTRAKTAANWSAIVKADYFKLKSTTSGIKSLKQSIFNVITYPNPVTDFVYFIFDIPSCGKVDILVYNLEGKLISKVFSGFRPEGTNTIPWIPKNVKSGIYVYKINYQGNVKTAKLVITSR